MKILFDIECLQSASKFRGIGRYATELMRELILNYSNEHDLIFLGSSFFSKEIIDIRNQLDDIIDQEKIVHWTNPLSPSDICKNSDALIQSAEIIKRNFIESFGADHFHCFSFFEGFHDFGVITVFPRKSNKLTSSTSVYDFIPLENPDIYFTDNAYKEYYFKKITEVQGFDRFLCISENTKDSLMQQLTIDKAKCFNINTGVSKLFFNREILYPNEYYNSKYSLRKPFILSLLSLDPHKNIDGLVKAYNLLPQEIQQMFDLVLIGPSRSFHSDLVSRQIEKCGCLNKNILIFNDTPDNDLVFFYQQCKFYICPSFQEGFGLPVAEAIASGALAIGSRIGALMEILQDPIAAFNPHDPISIMQRMKDVILAPNNYLAIKKLQHANIQKYNWKGISANFLKVLINTKDEFRKYNNDDNSNSDSVLSQVKACNFTFSKHDFEEQRLAASIERIPVKSENIRRVFVDISELAQRDARTGIQRVTRAVLHNLMNYQDNGLQIIPVYATIDSIGYRFANEYSQKNFNLRFANADFLVTPEKNDIFLGLDLQHHVLRVQSNYLSILADQGVQISFYLYDLLPLQFPEFWPPEHMVDVVHHEWLSIICSFDQIICISETTAKRCREFLEQKPKPRIPYPARFHTRNIKRLNNIKPTILANPLGYDIEATAPSKGVPSTSEQFLKKLQNGTTYLMVGTLEPRKGHKQILKVFENLWERGFTSNLVIVGKQGWSMDDFVNKLRLHPQLEKKLFWFESASDEYLEEIYKASQCLIAGSYDEGFGLPLVEAARFKKPIIARDIDVFREVASSNAFYFKGTDIEEIAEKISIWEKLFEKNEHPEPNIPLRTWNNHVGQLVKILKNYKIR